MTNPARSSKLLPVINPRTASSTARPTSAGLERSTKFGASRDDDRFGSSPGDASSITNHSPINNRTKRTMMMVITLVAEADEIPCSPKPSASGSPSSEASYEELPSGRSLLTPCFLNSSLFFRASSSRSIHQKSDRTKPIRRSHIQPLSNPFCIESPPTDIVGERHHTHATH